MKRARSSVPSVAVRRLNSSGRSSSQRLLKRVEIFTVVVGRHSEHLGVGAYSRSLKSAVKRDYLCTEVCSFAAAPYEEVFDFSNQTSLVHCASCSRASERLCRAQQSNQRGEGSHFRKK